MTLLPQAEHHISALDKQRRKLLRAGLVAQDVNRQLLLPRLADADWSLLTASRERIDARRFLETLLRMGTSPALSLERLEELARDGLGRLPILRRRPVAPFCEGHQPVLPELLESRLKRFFEWTASPAFQTLQPLLQLSLTQLRLFEIFPWEEYPVTLSLWFGVLPLLAADHLLPAYSRDHLKELGSALSRGFAFDTVPLVGLNLDAALRSYELANGE